MAPHSFPEQAMRLLKRLDHASLVYLRPQPFLNRSLCMMCDVWFVVCLSIQMNWQSRISQRFGQQARVTQLAYRRKEQVRGGKLRLG